MFCGLCVFLYPLVWVASGVSIPYEIGVSLMFVHLGIFVFVCEVLVVADLLVWPFLVLFRFVLGYVALCV